MEDNVQHVCQRLLIILGVRGVATLPAPAKGRKQPLITHGRLSISSMHCLALTADMLHIIFHSANKKQ